MALSIIIAPLARRDLTEIRDFISPQNSGAAVGVLSEIELRILSLADRPFLGPVAGLPRLPKMRKLSVPPYVVFYLAKSNTLEIVRVLHGARDVKTVFKASPS